MYLRNCFKSLGSPHSVLFFKTRFCASASAVDDPWPSGNRSGCWHCGAAPTSDLGSERHGKMAFPEESERRKVVHRMLHLRNVLAIQQRHQIDGSITRRRVMRGHRKLPGCGRAHQSPDRAPAHNVGRVGLSRARRQASAGRTFHCRARVRVARRKGTLLPVLPATQATNAHRTHEPVETWREAEVARTSSGLSMIKKKGAKQSMRWYRRKHSRDRLSPGEKQEAFRESCRWTSARGRTQTGTWGPSGRTLCSKITVLSAPS